MANSAPGKKASQEVEKRSALDDIVPEIMSGSVFDEDALRSLSSFDDALKLAERVHGQVENVADVLGDGFTLVNDKADLEGLAMILLEWTFRQGDYDRPYVSVRAVARLKNGQPWKVIFNDGGSGIAEQLAKHTKKTGKTGGLVVPKGLNRSEYDNEFGHGITYYLALTN